MSRIQPGADVILCVAPPTLPGPCYFGSPAVVASIPGNDVTGNGSPSAPFATPQRAVDELYANYDLQCRYKPTIQLAVGSGAACVYPGVQISGRILGQGGSIPPLEQGIGLPAVPVGKYLPFTIVGDPTSQLTAQGCWIAPGLGGTPSIPGVSLTDGAGVKLIGLGIDTGVAAMDCLDVFGYSTMELASVVFGNAGNVGVSPSTGRLHIGTGWKGSGTVIVNGPIWVNGGAAAFYQGDGPVYWNNNGPQGQRMLLKFGANGATSKFDEALFIVDGVSVYANNVDIQGPVTAPYFAQVMRGGVMDVGLLAPVQTQMQVNLPGGGLIMVRDDSTFR